MCVPIIIGAGLAGLTAALALAPQPVIVLGRKIEGERTSSVLAQGGLAAAVGADDTPALHAQDTLAAGAGLCDPAIVALITSEGPKAVQRLADWGVPFDRDETGALALGLEGAHSRRRVVHAGGDGTGAAIMRTLAAKAKATPSITIIEDVEVTSIETDARGASGVVFRKIGAAQEQRIATRHVILATGSACALWRDATVPLGSWGHGLALAARAGAQLRDLEFVQFHPTALDVGEDPMPLISEALRGEGAKLVTEEGAQFVDELAPRDIVARAIAAQIEAGHSVFLDARGVANMAAHFPTITESCRKAGIDPSCDLIPVRPVAHYHMGGVMTDGWGRTNVPGLWACGEGACTGLHGANRLASNSLLEAAVMGARVAENVRQASPKPGQDFKIENYEGDPTLAPDSDDDIRAVREIMSQHVGLRRSAEGLCHAIAALEAMAPRCTRAKIALMIAHAALARSESRGAHERIDMKKDA